MIKRTPSRNSRSRGYKVKHVLQICLLLGVCFWLIYQVKHSHDKKKEFDEKDTKTSVRAERGDGVSNLGRKGLHPRVQEVTKNEKHEEDDDEETIVEEEVSKTKENNLKQKKVEDEMKNEEEEGNKHEGELREEGTKHEEEEQEEEEGNTHEEEGREEEGTKHEEEEKEEEEEEGNKLEDEEQEEETKIDETEDVGRGGGDDERDQEKIGREADHEDDIVDEERGREEEGGDNESRSDEGEDKENHVDHKTSKEDQDHDGGVQNDHEAREEQYNADDASSAVTHDTQTISIEPEKVNYEKNENSVTKDSELEKNSDNNPENTNGDQKNSISQFGEGVVADNGSPQYVTSGDKKDDEISKDQLPKDANDQSVRSNKSMDLSTEAGNNLIGGNTEISGSSQPNETVVTSDSDQAQKVTVDGSNTGDASDLKTTKFELVSNGDSNSSTNSESAGSDKMVKLEVTAETGGNSGLSSITKETADATQEGKSDINNESSGTDKNSNSASDGTGAVVNDPIDSSDSSDSSGGQDEKEALIDLSTLPGNSEGFNGRDAAAE